MDARSFISSEHRRITAKAARIENAGPDQRVALLASYVADAELHAQLIDDMCEYLAARDLRTLPNKFSHADAEHQLLAALASMDPTARRQHTFTMALRRRALDREYARTTHQSED